MPWNRSDFQKLAMVSVFVVLSALQLNAAPADNRSSQAANRSGSLDLQAQAEQARQQQQWDRAAALYLQLIFVGHNTPEIREKVQDCLRRATQTSRFRDPAFQHYVVSMELSESLNLYHDVLVSLEKTYSDRRQASVPRLFSHGLSEVERAIDDAEFRKLHLAHKSPNISAFREYLKRVSQNLPSKPSQARHRILEMIPHAQVQLGLSSGSALVFEFLCGACSGLDEYTMYVMPEKSRKTFSTAVLELASYGILVGLQYDSIVVQGILPDSFVELNRPQLRVGDRLVRINGRNVMTMPRELLVDALGTPGSSRHELEFESPQTGNSSLTLDLPVAIPSVLRAEILREGIGYIRLGAFRENALTELDHTLAQFRDKAIPLRGLILDLRGNPGGQFRMGVLLTERFQPNGILVTTKGQLPEFADRVFSSASGAMAIELPLIVLVDARTMSSAEIMAAALKGHGRAQIVGMPTYGKGLVQCPIRLPVDSIATNYTSRGSLIVTIARVFGPNQEPIHRVGVVPHIIEADSDKQLLIALDRLMMLPPLMK